MIVTTTIAAALYSYFQNKGLDKLFASHEDFIAELKNAIDETLRLYEEKHPEEDKDQQFSFYKSQIIIDELLKFRVMHKEDYDSEILLTAFKNEPHVIPPTKVEIEEFYGIFLEQINGNEKLRQLEIKLTFEDEVFSLSKKVTTFIRDFDNVMSSFTGDLEIQWKSRIEAYISTIKDFKPATALSLLNSFEQSLTESTKQPSANQKANIAYQKAICYNFLQDGKSGSRSYIEAYKLNPLNKVFKEQAALSYFKLGESDKALALAEELISEDEFNSFGWAIRILTTDVNDLKVLMDKLSSTVREDTTFLKLVFNGLNLNKKFREIERLYELDVKPDFSKFVDQPVTISSYSEYIYWINAAIHNYFITYYFDFSRIDDTRTEEVQFLNSLLTKYLEAVSHTELPEKNGTLEYLLAYTNFLLTKDVKYALEMNSLHPKLGQSDYIFTLIGANALQLVGKAEKALELINNSGHEETEILFLKAFCCIKAHNIELYLETTRKFLASFEIVPPHLLIGYINTLIQLKTFGKLDQFVFADFLAGKSFENETDEQLVIAIAKSLFGGSSPEIIAEINELIKDNNNPELLSLVAITFYYIGAYEESVQLFRTFLDKTVQSRELFYYIYALFNTKKDNKELLDLFEKWRKEFEFHPDFLRAEVQMYTELLEWNKCIAICQYFRTEIPNDEFILVHLALALDEEGSEESRTELIKIAHLLRDFSYQNPGYVKVISNILINKSLFQEALDLLYRYAINEENKELRTAYFFACVASSKANLQEQILKEFNEVEEGSFVKYERDHKISIVELNEKNLLNPFFKEFIGCGVGGAFSFKRPITGTEEMISIVRIMNKYLSLHDEILEEVHNDPFSGMPMQSIQFDGDPENMLETLTSMFGKNAEEGKVAVEDRLKKYYQGELSFTEIILGALHNDFIGGYYHLANTMEGIVSIPMVLYRPVVHTGLHYVIDYTSLIALLQLYQTHQVKYPDKFIISGYIVDNIKKELIKQRSEKPELSVSITSNAVIPHFEAKHTQENNIKYLTGLLQWIEENCTVEISDKFLDYTREMVIDRIDKPFTHYTLNTILLVNDKENRVLITDDSMYFSFKLLGLDKVVSTEWYVKQFIGEDHPALYEFIKNQYIGFSFSDKQLNEEFNKELAGQKNHYNHCLNSIKLQRIPYLSIPVIKHIKNIALNDFLSSEAMLKHITNVFVVFLKGVDRSIRKPIEFLVNMECQLMGLKLDLIQQSLADALLILDSE